MIGSIMSKQYNLDTKPGDVLPTMVAPQSVVAVTYSVVMQKHSPHKSTLADGWKAVMAAREGVGTEFKANGCRISIEK